MASPNNQNNVEKQKIVDLYEELSRGVICHTPLHAAAAAGMTHLALELVNLKPSLARTLNLEGLSPMHLALKNGHDKTVAALMALDPSLIRVKGRGLETPLHYAAKIGADAEIVAEFLSACPSSIEDLTSQCETAMHVAVKNGNLGVCEVLYGWMRRMDLVEILNWKDEDGNTVLHIAALTNQAEVINLVKRSVVVKAKNFQGRTALDLYDQQGHPRNIQVYRILSGWTNDPIRVWIFEKLLLDIPARLTGAQYLRRRVLSVIERRDSLLGLNKGHRNAKSANELRSIYLVVAALIATATYQGMLTPPDSLSPTQNDDLVVDAAPNGYAPTPAAAAPVASPPWKPMVIKRFFSALFSVLNTGAFTISMTIIVIFLVGMPMSGILISSGGFLLLNFAGALTLSISQGHLGLWNLLVTLFFFSAALMAYAVPIVAHKKLCELKSRLDIPGRRLGGFI